MLRRIISLVLALCMLLGIGLLAPAASAAEANLFPDANEIQYKEAVDILVGLDIVDGAQGLKPEGTFTRGMLATLIARLCLGGRYSGEEISTMYGKYENPFSDVLTGQWRDGTIAYCARTGIIQGRGNGTFDPTGGVTGYEFSRILLRALGYGDRAALEILSDVDMSGDLTTEDGLLMTAAALDQPIATMENGKATYGETLAERNYRRSFAELRKEIRAGTFQLPETEQTEEMERLASNKHYTNYTDRYQSDNQVAARTVVGANMIPTYSARKVNYILPEEDYTWADAAQFITTLLLGEEKAAKLTDGGMGYCMEEGYIPSDQDADDPITGTDLVKIMCTLLGNFWLDSAAGQFAAVHGLLEGVTGKLGTANTELETMEDHTALNALLAEPLNRDNAMQMIYNFLNATMPNSEETVAEHFGVDLIKYVPTKKAVPMEELSFVPVQTIEKTAGITAPAEAKAVVRNAEAGTEYQAEKDGESEVFTVTAEKKTEVKTTGSIITLIQKGLATLFDLFNSETWGNIDSYTVTVEDGKYSGSTATFTPEADESYNIVTQTAEEFNQDGSDGAGTLDNTLVESDKRVQYDENNNVVKPDGDYELPVYETETVVESAAAPAHSTGGTKEEPPTGEPAASASNEQPVPMSLRPSAETSTETPVETPAETPVEAPVETPAETPVETPAETPAETPVEAPAVTPVETPAETPAVTPVEAPVETPAETPVEAPVETPTVTPVETPAETPSETPAEAPVEITTDQDSGDE